MARQNTAVAAGERGSWKRRLWANRYLYAIAVPSVAWFLIFHYYPMYGSIIAFKRFNLYEGIWRSPWAGFSHFIELFGRSDFYQIMRNTLVISGLKLLFVFPSGIAFALLLNELRKLMFKRVVQTISYLPHFVSWVVVAGLCYRMLSPADGPVNQVLAALHLVEKPVPFLMRADYFWGLAVITENWKEIGWNAVIYLAAISAVNPQLYEAARVDGASRWRQTWHVTLPGIAPTILIMFLLAVAGILNSNFDQMWLLRNNTILQTADVLDTHVYHVGMRMGRYDYATAVGLFKSVIGLALLFTANKVVRKLTDVSIW